MLSSDRPETAPSPRRKKGRRAVKAQAGTAGHDRAHAPSDPQEPWDAESAETLTRLYESDEGQLHKPYAGERAQRPAAQAHISPGLEQHLSDLAERLQDSLARLDPNASFAALNSRLEAFEERFSHALGRISQHADGHGLRAIEAHVLNLADHLQRTRERLEQIGTLEEQVRGLSQRPDGADQQQLGALGKLLRDYIGEWRESEQRTASALQRLEEAIQRLGDAVDAMEASKPAPELSLPPLGASHAGGDIIAGDPLSLAGSEGPLAPKSYQALLDAADYAPRVPANDWAAPFAVQTGLPAETPIAWSDADDSHDGLAERDAGHRTSRITALRAKLRQAQMPRAEARHEDGLPQVTDQDAPGSRAASRMRPGLLLIVGVAFLAGGAYLLVHAITARTPPPLGPALTEPAAHSDIADPTRRPAGNGGGSS